MSEYHSRGPSLHGNPRWRLDCKKCWNAAHGNPVQKVTTLIELSGTAALATKHWAEMGEWITGGSDARPDD